MSGGVFVTAAGTGEGKTYISALIVKSLRNAGINAGYYKPVLSGAEGGRGGSVIPGDTRFVLEMAGIEGDPMDFTGYAFREPVSPHLAARLEGTEVKISRICRDFKRISGVFEYVAVEGCGGIGCPLSDVLSLADVIKAIGLEIIIVTPSGLGAISLAVTAAYYAKGLSLPVKGIIMNMYENGCVICSDNRKTIERLIGLPVIAAVEKGAETLDAEVFL